jgi:hypothetical protein
MVCSRWTGDNVFIVRGSDLMMSAGKEKKRLIVVRPNGDRYTIDLETGWINGSAQWIFSGIRHVKRTRDFIPRKNIPAWLEKNPDLLWKNRNPQWTVQDKDHGTTRIWGNTRHHGIKYMYLSEK